MTEGEGGFESALLDALANEETLRDPRDLFKRTDSADDTDDMAFWNVEAEPETDEIVAHMPPTTVVLDLDEAEPIPSQPQAIPQSLPANIDLTHFGFEATVDLSNLDDLLEVSSQTPSADDPARTLSRYVHLYIESLQQSTAQARRQRIPQLVSLLQHGEIDPNDETIKIMGVCDPLFAQYESHQQHTAAYIGRWLKNHKLVSPLDESVWQEAGRQVVELALMAYGHLPLRLDAFFTQPQQLDAQHQLEARVATQDASHVKPAQRTRRDLLAVPEEVDAPTQLAMF